MEGGARARRAAELCLLWKKQNLHKGRRWGRRFYVPDDKYYHASDIHKWRCVHIKVGILIMHIWKNNVPHFMVSKAAPLTSSISTYEAEEKLQSKPRINMEVTNLGCSLVARIHPKDLEINKQTWSHFNLKGNMRWVSLSISYFKICIVLKWQFVCSLSWYLNWLLRKHLLLSLTDKRPCG